MKKLNQNEGSVGKYISFLYRYGQCYIGKELDQYNIGKGQFIFLKHLYTRDGIRQEDLAALLNMDKGTTARAIKKLEEEGYILRKMDPEDRRAYRIYVTDKAKNIEEGIERVLRQWTDILTKGFTEEEKDISLKLFKRMAENVHNFKSSENCCKNEK